jgi:hypothetical protein
VLAFSRTRLEKAAALIAGQVAAIGSRAGEDEAGAGIRRVHEVGLTGPPSGD